jgi:hypothetical protein
MVHRAWAIVGWFGMGLLALVDRFGITCDSAVAVAGTARVLDRTPAATEGAAMVAPRRGTGRVATGAASNRGAHIKGEDSQEAKGNVSASAVLNREVTITPPGMA